MPGAVAPSVATARRSRRPRWSQQFLAEELTHRGYPTTRNQIARLELSEANQHRADLVAAVAAVLAIDAETIVRAVASDYLAVHQQLARRLGEGGAGSIPVDAP